MGGVFENKSFSPSEMTAASSSFWSVTPNEPSPSASKSSLLVGDPDPKTGLSQADRFWSKVLITDGCWLWVGRRNPAGYGFFRIREKPVAAHRLSYMYFNGPILKTSNVFDTCVCHTCDVKNCVRPSHLFLGTQRENVHDMMRKGRRVAPPRRAGVDNPQAKLTASDVILMRLLSDFGVPQKKLGEMFGVAQSVAGDVVLRRSWRHV